MITLLHGDQKDASRAELNRLKTAAHGKEIRELDGKNVEAATLTQALESSSLFGGSTLVIIENLVTKAGKKTKQLEGLLSLVKNAKETDVILWEEKEVTKTVIAKLGLGVQIRLFKIPSILFQVLDEVKPGQVKSLLPMVQELLQTEPAEIFCALLVKRVRQLIVLRDGLTPGDIQPWQASRLTSQTKLFTMEKLLTMYRRLLDSEYALKTGATPFSLPQLVEQFFIQL